MFIGMEDRVALVANGFSAVDVLYWLRGNCQSEGRARWKLVRFAMFLEFQDRVTLVSAKIAAVESHGGRQLIGFEHEDIWIAWVDYQLLFGGTGTGMKV